MISSSDCPADAYKPEDDQLVLFTQAELNGLTRDINLSKESAQLLASHLKEKKPVGAGNNILLVSRPRERIKTFVHFPERDFTGLLQQHC